MGGSNSLEVEDFDSTVRRPKNLFGLGNRIKTLSSRPIQHNSIKSNLVKEITNQDIDDRIGLLQVEIIEMMQKLEHTLLSNMLESQQKIIDNVSKLSDRIDTLESVISKNFVNDD